MPQLHLNKFRSRLLQLESLHDVAVAQGGSHAAAAARPAQLLEAAELAKLLILPSCTPAELEQLVDQQVCLPATRPSWQHPKLV
jgi:hypothetical protein